MQRGREEGSFSSLPFVENSNKTQLLNCTAAPPNEVATTIFLSFPFFQVCGMNKNVCNVHTYMRSTHTWDGGEKGLLARSSSIPWGPLVMPRLRRRRGGTQQEGRSGAGRVKIGRTSLSISFQSRARGKGEGRKRSDSRISSANRAQQNIC